MATEVRRAAKKRRMETIAFHQCTYGADYPKPTRLLSDAHGLLQLGYPGWPVLNKELYYLGPLPRACGHEHPPLIGTNTNGGFKTGTNTLATFQGGAPSLAVPLRWTCPPRSSPSSFTAIPMNTGRVGIPIIVAG